MSARMFRLTAAVLILGVVSALPTRVCGADLNETARKINFFGVQLYGKLADKSNNLAVSPLSVTQCLLMLVGGAQKETKKEILFTLGLSEEDAALMPGLRRTLGENGAPEEAGFQLAFADSLWAAKGCLLKSGFLTYLKSNFSAIAQNAPFAKDSEKARAEINLWTQEHTRGMVRDLLPPGSIDADTRLVLCDAVYFFSRWQNMFEAKDTQLQDFHNLPLISPKKEDGKEAKAEETTVKVSMMHRSLTCRLEEGKDFRAIRIPYQGGEYSMVVILPKDGSPLSAAEKAWPEHEGWFQGWEQQAALALPKFSLGTTVSLRDTLLMLGIADAFTGKADFGGISDEQLTLSDVLHGCQIEVKEEGTRAAAATGAVLKARSASIQKATPFVVDRPFVYLIRHEPTKLVLFAGRVRNLPDEQPKEAKKEIRATGGGYGPWKFGMTMDEVSAVTECGPYRPEAEGGLQCIHAPWEEFNDKHADFFFDGSGRLSQIRLWLNVKGINEDQAKGYLEGAEKFLASFGKGKEKGLAEQLLKKVAAENKDRPAVVNEDVTEGPGHPRIRVTLNRHPQLNWFVYLTFNPL